MAAEERWRIGAALKFSTAIPRPNAPAIRAAAEIYAWPALLLTVLGDHNGFACGGGCGMHEDADDHLRRWLPASGLQVAGR